MSDVELPKYTVVSCIVVGHQHYGLLVRADSGQCGFVDRVDLLDEPDRQYQWPAVGSQIDGVVLGYTRDRRLRLSARPRDLFLVRSVGDPGRALDVWQSVNQERSYGPATLDAFYRFPEARVLLRWALTHPDYSSERKHALELISAGPESFADLAMGESSEDRGLFSWWRRSVMR